uniref:transposase n=1 Tax=Streptococcus agalactiae TaxID=1311 RepID=UPI001E28EA13
ELYQHRKETIERLFGTAKEYHNLRYTREKGKSKMEAKVGLTLACLNIKKLVKMMTGKTCYFTQISQYYWFMGEFGKNIKKTNIKNDVCLHSERDKSLFYIILIKNYFAIFAKYSSVRTSCEVYDISLSYHETTLTNWLPSTV